MRDLGLQRAKDLERPHPRLLDDVALGRADGRYAHLLNSLGRASVLVLDHFLLTLPPSRRAGTCSR